MWVKVCGLRDLQNAMFLRTLADKGMSPDAVGLNFYSQSKRYVTPEVAARIVDVLPDCIEPIALFVNHSAAEIRDICKQTAIRTIQLHGDETPEFIAELTDFAIVRAFRVDESGLEGVASQLERFRQLGVTIQRCLVDSFVSGAYGGTGHRAPWGMLRREWQADWPELVLAGGLTPLNVAEAIQTAGAKGVDVASGVESSSGVHDLSLITRFVLQARTAAKQ